MYNAKTIPTIFAVSIAEQNKLLPINMEDLPEEDKYTIKQPEQRLVAFQTMSVAGTFDDAMLAYHGVKLSEEQNIALRLIYESTVPWLIGHVVAELIDSAGIGKSAEFILTQLIKDGKVDEKTAKDMLVRMTVIDPTKQLTNHEGDGNGKEQKKSKEDSKQTKTAK